MTNQHVGFILFIGGLVVSFIQFGWIALIVSFMTTVGYFMINEHRFKN